MEIVPSALVLLFLWGYQADAESTVDTFVYGAYPFQYRYGGEGKKCEKSTLKNVQLLADQSTGAGCMEACNSIPNCIGYSFDTATSSCRPFEGDCLYVPKAATDATTQAWYRRITGMPSHSDACNGTFIPCDRSVADTCQKADSRVLTYHNCGTTDKPDQFMQCVVVDGNPATSKPCLKECGGTLHPDTDARKCEVLSPTLCLHQYVASGGLGAMCRLLNNTHCTKKESCALPGDSEEV